jgi:hypothetical protein
MGHETIGGCAVTESPRRETHYVPPRLGRATRIFLVIAALYATAFLLVGAFVPTYSSTSSSETSNGVPTHSSSSATMVAVNGMRVLFVLALPLVAVGLVWVSVMWRRRHGHLDVRVLAWVVVGLLGVMSILAMLSVGIFIMPLVMLLAAACAKAPMTPSRAPVGFT